MTKKLSKQTCELTLMHTFDKNSGMKHANSIYIEALCHKDLTKLKEKTKSKNNQKIMPLVHT